MKFRTLLAGSLVALAAALPLAQSKLDPDINDKIRKEEADELAGDADAALPRRRLRPAPDRLAEPQGRGRVGGEDDDRAGAW